MDKQGERGSGAGVGCPRTPSTFKPTRPLVKICVSYVDHSLLDKYCHERVDFIINIGVRLLLFELCDDWPYYILSKIC